MATLSIKYSITFFLTILLSSYLGQVTLRNLSDFSFTNFYIVESDSIVKTSGPCDFVIEKNLLENEINSKDEVIIFTDLKDSNYYNILLFNNYVYGNTSYVNVVVDYYISGFTKEIIINNKNIDSTFQRLHCLRGLSGPYAPGWVDFEFEFENRSDANIIKVFYNFYSLEKLTRCHVLQQWNPIVNGETRILMMEHSRSLKSSKVYIKYYTESNGIIEEHFKEQNVNWNQNRIKIIVQ